MAGLEMAKKSTGKEKVMFFTGSGRGTCRGGDEPQYLAEALQVFTSANAGAVKVNTVALFGPERTNDEFLTALAERNGGTYTRIVWGQPGQ